jgi:SAM-dependent methyltransferase
MGFYSILTMAQQLAKAKVHLDDVVIDATCGNGVDTLFLAQQVGVRGTVYAFDIQTLALEHTKVRLAKAGYSAEVLIASETGQDFALSNFAKRTEPSAPLTGIHLIKASHAEMQNYIPPVYHGHIAAILFNLGFLPNADPSIITTPRSTLPALQSALALLRPHGILTIAVYPGHSGGDIEAEAVTQWATTLPQDDAQVLRYQFPQNPHAAYLFAIERH